MRCVWLQGDWTCSTCRPMAKRYLTIRCAAACVQNKYELIFAKFDKENKGGLYYKDMLQLMARNRNVRSSCCGMLPLVPHLRL